jgi:Fe-S cluster assembly ATPase SufC
MSETETTQALEELKEKEKSIILLTHTQRCLLELLKRIEKLEKK